MSRKRVAVVCAVVTAGVLWAPVASATPAVLHVSTDPSCSDTGPGSAAVPFCTAQRAADVVQPGQTVSLTGQHSGSVVLTRSGTVGAPIVFDGGSTNHSQIFAGEGTAFTVRGAQHVVVRNIGLYGQATGVLVDNSAHVVVDRDLGSGVRVTGGSTHVAVTRVRVEQSSGPGILVEGGSDHLVAGVVSTSADQEGILVSGAPRTAVTGNTVRWSCAVGVRVTGDATGSTLANTIVHLTRGPEQSAYRCPAAQSEVVVDEVAAVGLSAHHNIVHSPFGFPLYRWAGTQYASAAALTAATGQGGSDLNVDPQTGTEYLPVPREGSPAIDSADSSAPGALAADYHEQPRRDDPLVTDTGTGPRAHDDRGAVELQDTWAGGDWKVNATRAPVGGTVRITNTLTSAWGVPFTCATDFGDGTTTTGPCAPTHAYTGTGARTIRQVISSSSGLTQTIEHQITIVAAGTFTPTLRVEANGAASVDAFFGTGPWNIDRVTLDFGAGGTPLQLVGTDKYTGFYGKPGTYTVTATITDANGSTGTAQAVFRTAGSAFVPHPPTRLLDTRATGPLPAFGTARLKVGGSGGVPAGVTAVAVNLTATNTAAPGFLTAFADGGARPQASNVNFVAGQTVPNMAVVPVADNGHVDIYNGSNGSVDVIADVTGYFVRAEANLYRGADQGVAPRLLDTRTVGGAPIAAGTSRKLTIAGAPGTQIPAGVAAVALNVTVTDPTGPGFVVVHPSGTTRPVASNLNFVPGQTVANSVIVPVGADGKIEVYAHASTHVVVDYVGYFATGNTYGRYVPITPKRQVDTRSGLGQGGIAAPLAARADGSFDLAQGTGAPKQALGAVVNATVTNPAASGYLTVYSPGSPRPTASTVNFSAGQTVPNLALAPLLGGLNGIAPEPFHNGSDGTIDLVVDVFGYFAAQ